MHCAYPGYGNYLGASLIGDGRMALILDVDALYRTGVKAPTRLIA